MNFNITRQRRERDGYNMVPMVSATEKKPIDGKLKASFFTYQRLCENSLATWWRNTFLMTAVALSIISKGGDDVIAHALLFIAEAILVYSLWAYHTHIKKIVEAAEERGIVIKEDMTYLFIGGVAVIFHVWFTLKQVIEAN